MTEPTPQAENTRDPNLGPKVEPASSRRRILKRVIAVSIVLLCLGGLVGGLCSLGLRLKEEVLKAPCSSNLKNIAAACITYANAHDGKFPASFEEMLTSSGISPQVLVCPASQDTPATGTPQEQAAMLSTGGHLSFVYVGQGDTTLQSDATTVIVYDHPGNHGSGVNVLFGDYHVGWIDKKDLPAFLKIAESGVRPVRWP